MDYLEPGFRELARRAARQVTRVRLFFARRRLGEALAELGLLGWQQADFDAETQRQVDEIHHVEREQSRLINQSAELGTAIHTCLVERDAAQRAHFEAHKQLETELRAMTEARAATEHALAEKKKTEPNFERRIPELDRELREVNKLYSELLLKERHSIKEKQELVRLRERTVSIPNEKSDLRTQHLRIVTEIRTLEETLARQSEAVATLQKRLHDEDAAWRTKEEELSDAIKAKEKEKAAADRQFAALERAKSNPYQRIGEVLAASGIGPVNQPEILERVREIEMEIALLEGTLIDSQAASKGEEPAALRTSLQLWGGIAALAVVVLFIVTFL